MNRRRVIPEIKVESRFRPPDLTLMTAWPIIAQPAWPPKAGNYISESLCFNFSLAITLARCHFVHNGDRQ